MNSTSTIFAIYEGMTLQDIFGLFTSLVILIAILVCLKTVLPKSHKHPFLHLFASLVWLALILLPLPMLDLPILLYCRGLWGDLSIATILLVILFICKHTTISAFNSKVAWYAAQDFRAMYWFLLMTAVVLYPSALGISYFDSYSFGYTIQFQFLLIGFAAIALWRQHFLLAHWVLLSLVAHQLNIYESNNLFDILLDPLVCLFALKKICKD